MQSKVDEALASAALSPSDRIRAAILREWDRMAGPGPTLTGEQRLTAARAARAATDEGAGPSVPSPPLTRAAGWVMSDAGGIDRRFIEDLDADGLSRLQLTEVIAVIARLSAIDHYMIGLGAELIPLPTAFSGEPTRRVDPTSAIGPAWVPTPPGDISAPTVLSALPDEAHATMDLHAQLYISEKEMSTNDFDRPLSRPAMELIAARTSFLNECFY